MMYKLILFFLLFSSTSFGQITGGAILDDGRKLVTEASFVQEGTVNGWAIYDLSVDMEGNVTSSKLVETNLKRTSAKMQIRNYASTLKFEKGTHYPKFHHVTIKITLVKPI